ncbi:MAG: hypothetical protein KUG82_12810 [Pseudomonadales bacterium]|nr:hypothetical protein [Pseudomonadales bacterium]
MRITILVMSFFCFLSLTSCGGGDSDTETGGDTSDNDDSDDDNGGDDANLTTSHRAGENCMACHVDGGDAESEAVFTVAGTAYKSGGGVQTQATIRLYTHDTNTVVTTLTTDDSGNFYTSDVVDGLFVGDGLVTGVDIEADGPSGTVTMPGLITDGACSACHGDSTGRITVN